MNRRPKTVTTIAAKHAIETQETTILPNIDDCTHTRSGDLSVANYPIFKLRHGGLTPVTRRHKNIVITAVTGGKEDNVRKHLNNMLYTEKNRQHGETHNHQLSKRTDERAHTSEKNNKNFLRPSPFPNTPLKTRSRHPSEHGRIHSHSSGDHSVANHPKFKKAPWRTDARGSETQDDHHHCGHWWWIRKHFLEASEEHTICRKNQQHDQTYNHQVFRCALVFSIFFCLEPRQTCRGESQSAHGAST